MKDAETLARMLSARKARFAERDQENRDLANVLEGRWHLAFPRHFRSPSDRPMVANALDTAARDLAELLTPLPTVTIPPEAESDAAQKRADKRGRIATDGYWSDWRWPVQQRQGALWYRAFGYVPVCLWPYCGRLHKRGPGAEFSDPQGFYPGPVGYYGAQPLDGFVTSSKPVADIAALYPDCRSALVKATGRGGSEPMDDGDAVEVARYHGPGEITLFLPEQRVILDRYELPDDYKHPTLLMAWEPGINPGELKGYFRQLIGVLLGQARLAALVLTYGERQVHAPLSMGENTQYVQGPDAIIRVAPGDPPVQKVQIPLTQDIWRELDMFERQLRLGSRRPSSRDGESPVSYATGKGIDALASGIDSQLKANQITLGGLHEDIIASAFAMDEALYGRVEKPIGNLRETYTPAKDIAGRYANEATYGLLMGINPSYATVMLSQLMAAGLISHKTAQEQLPLIPSLSKEVERLRNEQAEGAMAAFVQTAAAAGDPNALQAAIKMAPDSEWSKILGGMLDQQQQAAQPPPEAAPGMPPMPGAAPSPTGAEDATHALQQGSGDVRSLGTLLGPLAAQLGGG